MALNAMKPESPMNGFWPILKIGHKDGLNAPLILRQTRMNGISGINFQAQKNLAGQYPAQCPFLSAAVQLNSEQLKPVFSWFKNLVVIRHGEVLDPNFTIERCENETSRQEILKFMKGADIDVDGIDIKVKNSAPMN